MYESEVEEGELRNSKNRTKISFDKNITLTFRFLLKPRAVVIEERSC